MASIHRPRTVEDRPNAYRYSRLSSRLPEYRRGDSPYHARMETLRKRGGRYEGELDPKDDVMIELLDVANQSPTTTVSTSAASKSAEAWMQCAMAMKEHEEAKIEAWKDEIDTELVFAALFSAILTAFDVEAYKWLQTGGDNGPSVYIVTNGALVLNTTITIAPDPSSSGPSTQHAVAINALWFSGLICSVAAASLGILVRQWLNQYTSRLTSVSPDIARVRQFRRDNLKKWKVAEIMMLLPILLQGAVVLFLVGLVLFLHQLNQKITEVAAVLVALLLTFLLVTTILPSIQDDCSYQSPQAWGFFVIFQASKRPLRSVARTISAQATRWTATGADGYFSRLRSRYARKLVRRVARFANKPNTYSWVARERALVEASGPVLDQHLLVEADAMLLEDDFLREVVRPCLNDMPAGAAIESYYDIMNHRADRIEHGLPYFDTRNDRAESVAILADLTLDALCKTRLEPASREHAIRTMQILEPLLVRSLPLTYFHFCRVFCSLLEDPDEDVRHLAFSILYQQLWRNLALADQFSSEGCHDLAALVKFMSSTRSDGNSKHFLDACDLVICLATLPSLSPSGYSEVHGDLQGTLRHLMDFFATPLWRNEPRLLYPIARIAPHLVALEKKYPRVLEEEFVEVLADVIEQAKQLNSTGNWEDKLIALEVSLLELRALRQGEGSATSHDEVPRPSFMRRSPLMTLPDA